MRWFLVFILLYCATLRGDEAFYAISSLRFFIEEGIECDISFSESDIQKLWDKAALSANPEIENARTLYDIDKNECAQLLEQAWNRLLDNDTRITQAKTIYPNFDDNKSLSKELKNKVQPYLLPLDHPITPILSAIFSTRATFNEEAFNKAGFITIGISYANFLRVALHPSVPNFLFKIYLDNESRTRNKKPAWECLLDRCIGARNIRKLIKKQNLSHFIVPKKWLYPLPENPPSGTIRHPVILVETYFELASPGECIGAWRQATKEVLDELYCILSHGYASAYLAANIPYAKNGKFACIDTEYPKRKVKYSQARQFFSDDMKAYWDDLVRKGGK